MLSFAVWIRCAGYPAVHLRNFRQSTAGERVADHRCDLILRETCIDVFVDRHRRRLIAAAQARNSAELRIGVRGLPESFFETSAQRARAPQMARHVLTNAHVCFRRRRQMKMGIKAGDSMQAIQRHINFFGESFQLIGGQVAELALNFPELAKNQGEGILTGESMHSRPGKQPPVSSGVAYTDITTSVARNPARNYSCARRRE